MVEGIDGVVLGMEGFAAGEGSEGRDFVLVALFVEVEALGAAGLIEEDAQGPAELADLESVFASGLWIGLVSAGKEEFKEAGGEQDGAGIGGIGGEAEFFGHLAGHFVAEAAVIDLFLVMKPLLVAEEFPFGDVLVGDAGMAESGEALGDGVEGDGVGDPLVDGVAQAGREASDFAGGTGGRGIYRRRQRERSRRGRRIDGFVDC